MATRVAPISVQVFICLNGDLDGPNYRFAVIDEYWDRFASIDRDWDYFSLKTPILRNFW